MAKLPNVKDQVEEEVLDNDLDWLDAVDDADQATVELEGPTYPVIQWVNGDKRMKNAGGVPYTGGWFLNGEAIDAEELPGWEAGELIHSDGESTEGFFARDLTFAIVRRRRSWRLRVDNKEHIFAWDKYDEAREFGAPFNETPYGRLHVLVAVQGLEEMGPFMLTMRGSISKMFSPSRKEDTIYNQINRLLLRPANALARKRGKENVWPMYAFWVTVGPKRDDKGAPVYDTVGREGQQSTVTFPSLLGLHDKMTPAEIGGRFIGKANLEAFAQFWLDAEEWQAAFDGMDLAAQTTDQDDGEEDLETEPLPSGPGSEGDARNNPYHQGEDADQKELPF